TCVCFVGRDGQVIVQRRIVHIDFTDQQVAPIVRVQLRNGPDSMLGFPQGMVVGLHIPADGGDSAHTGNGYRAGSVHVRFASMKSAMVWMVSKTFRPSLGSESLMP